MTSAALLQRLGAAAARAAAPSAAAASAAAPFSLAAAAPAAAAFATAAGGAGGYKLPDLPYSPGALEPYISGAIMELHHAKHHNAYVTNLNKALEAAAEAEAKRDVASMIALQEGIKFNGGGAAAAAAPAACFPSFLHRRETRAPRATAAR